MRFPFEEQAEYLRTLQQGASASVQCTLLMSTRAHDFRSEEKPWSAESVASQLVYTFYYSTMLRKRLFEL